MASLKLARTAGVVALLLGALALPAAAGAQEAAARVRVLHLSPDAPKIDLYVDGTSTLTAVPFKTATKHAQVPAGHTRPSAASARNRTASPTDGSTSRKAHTSTSTRTSRPDFRRFLASAGDCAT